MGRQRVATVITRLQAGGGGVALRGALALDPDEFDVTIVTGGAGVDGRTGTRSPSTTGVLFGADAVDGAPEGDLLPAAYAAGLEVARVPALVPPISPVRDRAALRTLTRLLADGGYDVVHTHSAKAGALGGSPRSGPGGPGSCTRSTASRSTSSSRTARRTAYVGLERRLGRHTDAFLAVGTAVATEALRRGTGHRRPDAHDPAGRRPGPLSGGPGGRVEALRRLGLPADARVVGTVGRVDYQKAPEHFVDALAGQPEDVYGVWVGAGPLADRMLARVRQRGLTDRFRWLGHRDDVPELLPGFDVFALASRYEGVPCVLVEAAAAGMPVVATAVNARAGRGRARRDRPARAAQQAPGARRRRAPPARPPGRGQADGRRSAGRGWATGTPRRHWAPCWTRPTGAVPRPRPGAVADA